MPSAIFPIPSILAFIIISAYFRHTSSHFSLKLTAFVFSALENYAVGQDPLTPPQGLITSPGGGEVTPRDVGRGSYPAEVMKWLPL